MKFLFIILTLIVFVVGHEGFGNSDVSRPNPPSRPKYWNILKDSEADATTDSSAQTDNTGHYYNIFHPPSRPRNWISGFTKYKRRK